MWVYLATWLVQDGEVAELSPGDHLGSTGLRLLASHVQAGSAEDSTVAAEDSTSGTLAYRVTGTVGAEIEDANGYERAAGAPVEYVLTSQRQRYIATAPAASDSIVAYSRFTLHGPLVVIGAYEFEEFGMPDVRTDWRVHRIMAEDRTLVPDAAGNRRTGPLIGRRTLDRMRMWEDDKADDDDVATTYLVDLHRAAAP